MKKHYRLPRNFTALGTELQRAREAAGLTQREVSLKLGYSSAQFISNFERGISSPPTKKARVLLKLYDVSPSRYIELQLRGERDVLRKVLEN